MGASEIFAIDTDPGRLKMSVQFGATVTLSADPDPVKEIMDRNERQRCRCRH